MTILDVVLVLVMCWVVVPVMVYLCCKLGVCGYLQGVEVYFRNYKQRGIRAETESTEAGETRSFRSPESE